MGWGLREDKRGKLWQFNGDGVKQQCFAWARAEGIYHAMGVEETPVQTGMMTTINFSSVVFSGYIVENYIQGPGFNEWSNACFGHKRDFQGLFDHLVELRSRARNKQRAAANKFGDVSDSNRDVLIQLMGQEAAAKFVRDTANTALVSLSAVATGGTALALLGGGATLKGVGKYQDTGSIGAAGVEVTFELLFGVINLKTFGADKVAKAAVAILCLPGAEMCKSIVGGDSMTKGLVNGLMEAVIGGGLPFLKDVSKLAVPVLVKALRCVNTEAVTSLVEGAGMDNMKNAAGDYADQKVNEAASRNSAIPGSPKLKFAEHSFIESIDADRQYITKYCLKPYQR